MAKRNTPVETIPGTKAAAARADAAEDRFVANLMEAGGISEADARKVLAVYRKHKVIKRSGLDLISVKHGAFFDREVILRALAES